MKKTTLVIILSWTWAKEWGMRNAGKGTMWMGSMVSERHSGAFHTRNHQSIWYRVLRANEG